VKPQVRSKKKCRAESPVQVAEDKRPVPGFQPSVLYFNLTCGYTPGYPVKRFQRKKRRFNDHDFLKLALMGLHPRLPCQALSAHWLGKHTKTKWPKNFFDFAPIEDAPDFKSLRN